MKTMGVVLLAGKELGTFETGQPLAPRFDIQMASDDPARVTLTIRYGERRLVLAFVR
jgi:hypothetical protein